MENAERLWLDCDADGALREVDVILATATLPAGREESRRDVNKALLLSAHIHFHLGKLRQSYDHLNRMQFDLFEVTQWIVENNKLVITYLENKVSVSQEFKSLLEKIQGLPCTDVVSLELHVSFNLALTVLVTNACSEVTIPGGHDFCRTKLQHTIERVCKSVHDDDSYQRYKLSIPDQLRLFWKTCGNDAKIGQFYFPLAWSCWLLALFWLMDGRVNDARELMELVIQFHKTKPTTSKHNGFIFSVMKENTDVQANSGKAAELLIAACHLALCYASLLNHNRHEALKQCDVSLNSKPEFIPGLIMKGLILYENGDYHGALNPLQQVLTLSRDNRYKATALNILGCVCTKLGKPHTALIKFRESFTSCFGHIQALFNTAVVYHELGDFNLEISLLKYILEIVNKKDSRKVGFSDVDVNIDLVAGITAKILGNIISNEHPLISIDIYCVQRCELCNAQLSSQFILYKIANSCYSQKRYSEAAEYFTDLLALINDKPVDLEKIGIPSMAVIYKESAQALSKSGRHEDSLTVCEHILLQAAVLQPSEALQTAKRRQEQVFVDENAWFQTKSLTEIMLCKAEALIQLQRPVEAYECYEQIIELLNKSFWTSSESTTSQVGSSEPDDKRQKTETGLIGINKCEAKDKLKMESYENLKGLVFNNQGLLLKSLGRKKEALLLLAQSISCKPDCIKYHYDHTTLLFDMGLNEEASQNWRKFRNVDQTEKTIFANTKSREELSVEESSLYDAMDTRAASTSCKKSTEI